MSGDMVHGPRPRAETSSASKVVPRVYCSEDAPLSLADGTPLYLEWIIEGEDGKLYRVPAEPGGWLKRNHYQGQPDRLKRVPESKAEIIAWLTYKEHPTAL